MDAYALAVWAFVAVAATATLVQVQRKRAASEQARRAFSEARITHQVRVDVKRYLPGYGWATKTEGFFELVVAERYVALRSRPRVLAQVLGGERVFAAQSARVAIGPVAHDLLRTRDWIKIAVDDDGEGFTIAVRPLGNVTDTYEALSAAGLAPSPDVP